MKMNINKACDLSSISVFPPNLRRRSSVGPAEPQASQQFRSQQSQQSFSQGLSSQRGGFSQMTQSSVDQLPLNDQRFSSQERDFSFKKVSCLPPINHKREDNQLIRSRSSSGLTHRWSSASAGESKSQNSEEFEQRFGMMETSLSRIGMVLDSIQSDIMQANRGTKEVFLETERIHQKLVLQDTSIQQLIKEQADVKASHDGGVKSILEELSKDPNQEKLQKIFLMLSAIPEQVETSLKKVQREICQTFTREIQVLASLKMPEPRFQVPTAPANENRPEQGGPAGKVLAGLNMYERRVQGPTAPRAKKQDKENMPEQRNPAAKLQSNSFCYTKQLQLPRNPYSAPARTVKTNLSPKIQAGGWKRVKPEQSAFKKRAERNDVKPEGTRAQLLQLEQCSVIIDSDEDIDGGFSCLLDGNTKANLGWDVEKETERLLRTARRTKRKFGNPIIIN